MTKASMRCKPKLGLVLILVSMWMQPYLYTLHKIMPIPMPALILTKNNNTKISCIKPQ